MYKIPFNYREVFKRVLIIMGVGRSGTTLLGKIMGSMKPTYYVFEPAIMKYFFYERVATATHLKAWKTTWESDAFFATLCEDYFLPLVQGRKLDFNPDDSTFFKNYWANGLWQRIKRRWKLRRRKDAIEHIKSENPLFIIKVPEFHACMNVAKEIFHPCFLHITRNPFAVIESAIERGWYSDEYMENMIDWVEIYIGHIELPIMVPWWIDFESKQSWVKWNLPTRNACVWRSLMEYYFKFTGDIPKDIYWLTYEDLCKYPEETVNRLSEIYNLDPTEITKRHLSEIRKNIREPQITINDIEEPERSKFANLASRLGYL